MNLKLAWLIYGSLDQPTGGYVYDRMIVERLRARAARVEVVSLIPNQPVSLEAVVDQLRALEPDALIGDALCATELGPLFEMYASLARRILLVHHLASWEQEIEPLDRAASVNAEQRALTAADQVVTTSFATAARLLQQSSNCRPKVVVPGADRLRRSERKERTSGVTLLGVGSVIARKRWDLLLETLDQLELENLCLRLIGDSTRDPAYSQSLHARIASSRYLAEHVKCLGVVDSAQLSREFACADALVLPSSLEGYGMVIAEALHAELPVIASRQAAISEALANHAEAALQFDDASQLRLHLLRFATQPALRLALRSAATRLTATLPTWRGAEARFYNLLVQSDSAFARTNSAKDSSDEQLRISSAARHGSENRTLARTSR